VSLHEVKVFGVFESQPKIWITSNEVASAAGVAQRTARAHCLKLTKLGMLDLAEVFPAHRYRLSAKASKRNTAYHQRLAHAKDVFGIFK